MGVKSFLRRMNFLRRIFYSIKFKIQLGKLNSSDKKNTKEIFLSLKNKYVGQRCFIVGNGPSLTISDLEMLKNEYTFASNRIFTLYNKTDWRPTFFAAQDEKVIRSILPYLEECCANSNTCFLSMIMYNECYSYVNKFDNIVWMPLRFIPPKKNKYKFSLNASKEVIEGLTITYSCIQLAKYMGFSKIYLLGVDHNYGITVDNDGNLINSVSSGLQHFKDAENVKIIDANLPKVVEMTRAYRSAELFSRANDFRIFNATRGGKLDVFERVNFDELILNSGLASNEK